MYTKNLWKIPLYQKSQDKSRGITTPWDWFGRDLGNLTLHGFARDGTRISRDLPNFSQDLVVCTDGTGIKKEKQDGIGIANPFFFTVLEGNGIFKIPRDHGIIPHPAESRGIFTTGNIPRKTLFITFAGPPGSRSPLIIRVCTVVLIDMYIETRS